MHRATIAGMALLLSGGVLADGSTIDEITVTATRRAMDIDDVSSPVSVVPADTPLLTDALRSAVGVFVQQTTPGQGAAIVRGLKGSSILHTVDGMRLNNAIFRSAPTQYLALVPAVAVERIEVIRGSPTSLYGSDAVGGVVQVVTHKPAFGERSGSASLAFDTAELAKEVSARLDIGGSGLAASVSGAWLETGDRRTGGGDRIGPSGFEARAARAILAGRRGTTRNWFIDAHFVEQPETPRIDELRAGFGQDEPASDEFLFAPNRRAFLHGQYRHDRAGRSWTTDLAWQRIDDDRISRAFGSGTRRHEENRSDLFGLSSTLAGESRGNSWIIGSEIYVDRIGSARTETDIDSGTMQPATPRYPDGSSMRQAALFANVTHPLGEAVLVNGGLRVTDVRVELAASGLTDAASIDVADLSGDLGAILRLADTWQLSANVGYGFRAPNVFDLGTLGNRPGNRFNLPNPSLQSENVLQFDAGIRHAGTTVRFELVMFHLDYDRRITSVATGATTPEGREVVQSANAAESRVYGVEIGFDAELTTRIDLSARLNAARGDEGIAMQPGQPADRMPPVNASIRLIGEVSERLSLAASLHGAASQDRLSERDRRDSRIDPDGTPGWARVDIEANWRLPDRWDISLSVNNLFDKRYRYHGSGIDAPGRGLSVMLRKHWEEK